MSSEWSVIWNLTRALWDNGRFLCPMSAGRRMIEHENTHTCEVGWRVLCVLQPAHQCPHRIAIATRPTTRYGVDRRSTDASSVPPIRHLLFSFSLHLLSFLHVSFLPIGRLRFDDDHRPHYSHYCSKKTKILQRLGPVLVGALDRVLFVVFPSAGSVDLLERSEQACAE